MFLPTERNLWMYVMRLWKLGLIPVSFGYSGANLLLTWPYEHYLTCYAGGEKTAQLLKGEITFDDPDIKGAFELLKADWDAGISMTKRVEL